MRCCVWHVIQTRWVDIRQRDLGALVGEGCDDPPANAARGTRDQNPLAVERDFHVYSAATWSWGNSSFSASKMRRMAWPSSSRADGSIASMAAKIRCLA